MYIDIHTVDFSKVNYEVLVDGVKIDLCIEADDERNYAISLVSDDGRHIKEGLDGKPLTFTHWGKVKIRRIDF